MHGMLHNHAARRRRQVDHGARQNFKHILHMYNMLVHYAADDSGTQSNNGWHYWYNAPQMHQQPV